MQRLISIFLGVSVLFGAMVLPSSAETTDNTAASAVSGYVSLTDGVQIAGADKRPRIHIDAEEYDSVTRAAGDLSEDIKSVTGSTPVISSSSITPGSLDGGISITENGMTVSIDFPVPENSVCYVAVYDGKGILKSVTEGASSDADDCEEGYKPGLFTFDEVLEKPSGGTIKAYVWNNMEPVTGALGMLVTNGVNLDDTDIVIGTLGASETIDALAENGDIDVSGIEGKWESFTIQEVRDTVVIAGSDKRGTIYGIYDLSEKIGVSPWHFWADVAAAHADNLYINLPEGGYTEGEPSVKYRGIFLNDEFNMSEWSKSMGNTGKNMNNATYEKIFELLLRLKANYLWPAMHTYSTAFNVTDGNAALADEYGIVMGSSHCEPILRNNLGELYTYQQEWLAAHPDKKLYINTTDDAKRNVSWMWTDKDADGNAVDNKEFLTDYWRARARANGAYENTYTLGMRGVHDGRFTTNMNSLTAMNEIIAAQTKILEEEVAKDGKDISEVPQVFIPYKEMLNLYNQGVTVPDYVTLMWTDDNFGYIRQLPTEAESKRSGGAGVYYHLSYYGRPTSYLWLSTTQLGLIREEMTKAYDMDAKEIWIANVGDRKPAETEIEYFLDLARNIDIKDEEISDRLAANAKRDFGFDDTKAAEYSDIMLEYYELANSRRPEHMVQGLYSLTDFGDEGQTLLDRYQKIEDRAKTLYDGLSNDKKPSFYELALYPIKGAHSMAEKYVYADKAKYYADNGYGAAVNKYAALSDAAYEKVVSDTNEYNTMLGGKWNKMMNPYQQQLKGSFGGPISGKLSNPSVTAVPYTTMTIVPEGGGDGLSFTGVGERAKFIDIINSGSGSFDWRARTSGDWIVINKTSGTVADDDRIYAGIDLSKKGSSVNQGSITFERVIGDTVVDTYELPVLCTSYMPELALGDENGVYHETDGYVSIEAEHYTNSVKNGDYEWKVEKNLGRSGDSVKIYPNRAEKVTTPNMQNSSYLEYEVSFTSSGSFPIDVYRMPTINEISGATMRCRIGVDDSTPVQFNGNTKTTDNSTGADAWGKGVLQNTEVLSGTINIPSAGRHTIRLYNESPGVVIDKFVITTGEKKASYYGAPESYNTKYNGISLHLPAASSPMAGQTGNITALFEPEFLITGVDETGVSVVGLKDVDETDTFVIASYDSSGNMIDATYTPHAITGLTAAQNSPYECSLPSLTRADSIQVMLLRGENSYEPVAPALTVNLSDVSLMAVYDNGYVYPATKMNDYHGKESVCVIESQGGEIEYIRQNTVKEDTYQQIPFNNQGKYNLKIKVAGEDGIITESFSTIKNITADTDPTSSTLYNWDFSTDQTGTGSNVPVLGGNAIYDSTNKSIRLTPTSEAGGSLTVDFDAPIAMAQGEKLTIVSKIAYGKLSKKYTDYTITDSNGNELIRSHITAYNSGAQLIQIGGKTVFEATSSLPDAIVRDNSAIKAGYTTYTTTIDVSSGEVTLVLSSAKGTETYTGKLPEGTSYDLKKLYFKTNYDNADRGCYVYDISVTRSKVAAYTITFAPVDLANNEAADAAVKVTDAVTGAVIAPETDGTYKLCDGLYNYTVSAPGFETVNETLELSPATESKTIKVQLTSE